MDIDQSNEAHVTIAMMVERLYGGAASQPREACEPELGLRARIVNRLRRSTSEVRLALPYSNLKIIRSPSQ